MTLDSCYQVQSGVIFPHDLSVFPALCKNLKLKRYCQSPRGFFFFLNLFLQLIAETYLGNLFLRQSLGAWTSRALLTAWSLFMRQIKRVYNVSLSARIHDVVQQTGF